MTVLANKTNSVSANEFTSGNNALTPSIPATTSTTTASTVTNYTILPGKLHFSFTLHANQAEVPYADVANQLCYTAVLQTLLKHPDIPVTLHLSGTWLTTMQWYNSSVIDLIKQGITTGQFEILGSTYAQNIIYNTNNWDNYYQIQQHKQVIYDILGVTPTGFWNPERVWNQAQYVPLIAGAGYQYTFVEDHIIQNSTDYSGSPEFLIRNVTQNNQNLLIVDDDKGIISAVDPIAPTTPNTDSLSTRIDNAINYLKSVYANDTNGDFLVSYGQDMEAWGLWQEERGIATTQQVASNLDAFLTRLENESSWLQVVHPGDFINHLKANGYTFEHMNQIDFGEAQWMTDAAKIDGYNSWLQWVSSDSDLQRYNQSFTIARTYLKTIESDLNNAKNSGLNITAADKIFSYAVRVFIANEYEYGCYGCKFSWYNRAKVAMIPGYAVTYALNPPSTDTIQTKDLDGDGLAEYIMISGSQFYVFSQLGGRLIFACNLQSGNVFVGGDDTATYTAKGINYELPNSYQDYTYPITKSDQWNRGAGKTYRIHQKSFNDQVDSVVLANNLYEVSILNNVLQLTYTTNSYKIQKDYSFNNGIITSTFYISNLLSSTLNYQLDIVLSPSYLALQNIGKNFINNSSFLNVPNSNNWSITMMDSKNIQQFNITGDANENFSYSQPFDELFGYHYFLTFQIPSKQVLNFHILLNSPLTVSNIPLSSTSQNKSTNSFEFITILPLMVILSIILLRRRKYSY